MIVVDTNVICYLFLTSPLSEAAQRVMRRDSDWAAPHFWRSEFRNVLAGYLRRGDLTLTEVKVIGADALTLMAGNEHTVSSDQVYDLVARSSCSAYDCEFVALAEDLGVPLVTADRQILADFPGIAIPLVAFAGDADE